MRRFRALDLSVQSKPDLTPVTDADLAAEDSLRNVLSRARPRDAMLGEEFGRTGSSPRCWIIDPIDGTKNFVRGVPVWATLIALQADGAGDGRRCLRTRARPPLVGRPGRRRLDRQVADQGHAPAGYRRSPGSRTPRCRTRTSRPGSGAGGSTRSSAWPGRSGGPGPTATSGRTCWSPRGRWTSPPRRRSLLWDLAALQVIVTEAGGIFTDLAGKAGSGRRQRAVHERPAARRGARHAGRVATARRPAAVPRAGRPQPWPCPRQPDERCWN